MELVTDKIGFMIAACRECDKVIDRFGIKQCSVCGCFISFKFAADFIIKQKCPLNKW